MNGSNARSSKRFILQFLLPPVLIIVGFAAMEVIFLRFHLGEGKIWGVVNYAGYYKVIPFGRAGGKYLYQDFPPELRPHINSLGFRGPEFSRVPAPGVKRVISLGDSSTFGFHNGDSQTYPAQLEVFLNRNQKSTRFEVINGGVPMANVGQMTNLLENEILGYRPAIVTLYSSYNDVIDSTYQNNFISYLYNFLYKHTEFGVWVTRQIKLYLANNQKTGGAFYPKLSRDEIEASFLNAEKFYFSNLRRVLDLCKRNGVLLVLVEQSTGTTGEYLYMDDYFSGLSSIEKDRYFERKLEREGYLNILESKFVISRKLAARLSDFASQNGVRFVNFAAIADSHLEWFAGPVHLNPTGNRVLAETLGQEILRAVTGGKRDIASHL